MAGWSYISELQSTSRVRDLIKMLSTTTTLCEIHRVRPPVIIRSPSALLSSSVSTNRSTFAWVREDLRYEWKQSWTNSSDKRNGAVVAVMDQGGVGKPSSHLADQAFKSDMK